MTHQALRDWINDMNVASSYKLPVTFSYVLDGLSRNGRANISFGNRAYEVYCKHQYEMLNNEDVFGLRQLDRNPSLMHDEDGVWGKAYPPAFNLPKLLKQLSKQTKKSKKLLLV